MPQHLIENIVCYSSAIPIIAILLRMAHIRYKRLRRAKQIRERRRREHLAEYENYKNINSAIAICNAFAEEQRAKKQTIVYKGCYRPELNARLNSET